MTLVSISSDVPFSSPPVATVVLVVAHTVGGDLGILDFRADALTGGGTDGLRKGIDGDLALNEEANEPNRVGARRRTDEGAVDEATVGEVGCLLVVVVVVEVVVMVVLEVHEAFEFLMWLLVVDVSSADGWALNRLLIGSWLDTLESVRHRFLVSHGNGVMEGNLLFV